MAALETFSAAAETGSFMEVDNAEASALAYWRTRDMATELLNSRPNESAFRKPRSQKMSASSHFDIDTCLARIRRDKAPVVRNAFEAAATAVLTSLEKEEKDDPDPDNESVNQDDLPDIVQDYKKVDALRSASFTRAHDNKDWAKRKPTITLESPIKAAAKTKKVVEKKSEAPKFTRNTPASSASALDARLTSSRAILCTAANVAFEALTPPLPGLEVDITDVPQNPNRNDGKDGDDGAAAGATKSTVANMGQVVVEAQTVGQRVESVADNAARRSARRYQYRKDNLRCDKPKKSFLQVKNPFAWKDDDSDSEAEEEEDEHTFRPSEESMTEVWANSCLPRIMSVLQTGVGHAVYHDMQWSSRHGRIANLLEELSREDNNFGLHLIVTTQPDVDRFAQEFRGVNSHLRLLSTVNTESLRALRYTGTAEQRTKLRKQFPDATGLPEAPFHVIITSYANFLQDYLHFCQTPFEVVIMDDGVSWMAAAQSDPNSPIGVLWDSAIWSKSDQQIGLAGVFNKDWDYSTEEFDEETVKDAWIGLTARHRIITASTLRIQQRNSVELVPVSGLVNFVVPHYADVVREEWDRSRISSDAASMEHFRKLLTRSFVVHDPDSDQQDIYQLAMQALDGKLPPVDRSDDPEVPDLISDDTFVQDGKVAYSRRSALQWLGSYEESWIRYELGLVSFQHILEAMKVSGVHGHMCEEVVTASSTTSSGATGQVAGTLAYRLAVRCGRHFGSEQGLRQHHSALHAPPGTWLCRTCGSDCITSQARTHHERSCGQPTAGVGATDNGNAPGTPSTGPGKGGKQQHGPTGVVGKKKGPTLAQAGAAGPDEKDPDGSIRVPGYRGVWVTKTGKHFVKINGDRTKDDSGSDTKYFDGIEEAAKKHDAILMEKKQSGKVEFNFKPDGSRIVYEDVSTSSTTGLGGSASVIPALSVINIKDLPQDVKPLLRDPRQTSRTGGNSKRHVYAYRGVCRQARKGHDRWQSQISFMGVNHYLGTFDSEWDAAAIYAWAHLILYGEEATQQAQKEGEEAAAAYEQEKRDIAEGKIAPPPQKPEKKRKPAKKKEGEAGDDKADGEKTTKKKAKTAKDEGATEKKPKAKAVVDKESIAPLLAKGVGKASVLAPRSDYKNMSDIELASKAATRLVAARELGYCVTDLALPAPVKEEFRPCAPVSSKSAASGGAMLLGLSSILFGWNSQACVTSRYFESGSAASKATSALVSEYGQGGHNEKFRSLVQGTTSIIGCASMRTQRVFESLGFGAPPVGGAVGRIDCHIGGNSRCCGEVTACIRYVPTASGDFQFSALSDDDVVTMNGQRITPEMGSFPLFNEDICTVGSRVFVFLLPTDT